MESKSEIDYEKCKTNRVGLYCFVIAIYLMLFGNTGSCDWRADRIDQNVKAIKEMKPCSQQTK